MYTQVLRFCEARGISVHRLEKELGFGKSTIARWQRSSPRLDSVKKVADFFGVTLEELVSSGERCHFNGKLTVFAGGEAMTPEEGYIHVLRGLISYHERMTMGDAPQKDYYLDALKFALRCMEEKLKKE